MNPPRQGEGDRPAQRDGGGGSPPAPKRVQKRALRKRTVDTARRLRREMSRPEVALWQQLRQRLVGLKFRRQHPVGPYVTDFFCHEAKLVIEVDGEAHNMGAHPERDDRRDGYLRELGFTILRIPAGDIMIDPTTVADSLARYAAQPPLHPSPAASGPPPRSGEEKANA